MKIINKIIQFFKSLFAKKKPIEVATTYDEDVKATKEANRKYLNKYLGKRRYTPAKPHN